MIEARIFIEGKVQDTEKSGADENFLSKLISTRNVNLSHTLKFVGLGGKDIDKFEKNIPNFIDKNSSGKNLIIIDADEDNIQERRTEITAFLNANNIVAEIYFFPNNSGSGELEDLLFSCIPDDKRAYLNCFSSFEECISSSGQLPPDKKDKLHIYCSSFLNTNERTHRGKFVYPLGNFFDARFFNVNSPSLDNLVNFLIQHLA